MGAVESESELHSVVAWFRRSQFEPFVRSISNEAKRHDAEPNLWDEHTDTSPVWIGLEVSEAERPS